MNTLKFTIVALFILLGVRDLSAQQNISIEITGGEVAGGTIHISLFNDAQKYKDKVVFLTIKKEPVADTIRVDVALQPGEYLISLFQDKNGNDDLDTNLLGFPLERVGLSRYDGRGIPGNFDKHKVSVSDTTKMITVKLYKIF